MGAWVLKHFNDGSKYAGHYVARPGSEKSYTRKLENAQTFRTKEEAQANACDEYAVQISELIR